MSIKDTLSNMFSLKNILSSLGKSVIGIDIGSSSIKIVELENKKGRAILKTYGEIALGPYGGGAIGSLANLSNEKLSEALHDILRESRATTANSGMAIPFKSSLVSLIEMPALPEKQLEEMIPIEARKYIPVPISEITLDWWIIPKDEVDDRATFKKNSEAPGGQSAAKDKNDVLVVSIHNEILNNYNTVVRNNNLNTSFFEIEMFSTIRALVTDQKHPVLVFDMGSAGTKLYVVERGVLKNSHIINKGSFAITEGLARTLGLSIEEAEKIKRNISLLNDADEKTVHDAIALTLDGILGDAYNFIQSFEHRSGRKIEEILLTGGGVAMKGFEELVEEKCKIKAIIAHPFGKVETPTVLGESLKTSGLEFAVAVGIALRKIQELE
jgi:type IV pilus assembly protein PilM